MASYHGMFDMSGNMHICFIVQHLQYCPQVTDAAAAQSPIAKHAEPMQDLIEKFHGDKRLYVRLCVERLSASLANKEDRVRALEIFRHSISEIDRDDLKLQRPRTDRALGTWSGSCPTCRRPVWLRTENRFSSEAVCLSPSGLCPCRLWNCSNECLPNVFRMMFPNVSECLRNVFRTFPEWNDVSKRFRTFRMRLRNVFRTSSANLFKASK